LTPGPRPSNFASKPATNDSYLCVEPLTKSETAGISSLKPMLIIS